MKSSKRKTSPTCFFADLLRMSALVRTFSIIFTTTGQVFHHHSFTAHNHLSHSQLPNKVGVPSTLWNQDTGRWSLKMPAEEFSARSLLLLSSRLCPPLHIFTLSGLDMGLWFKDFPLHACNIIHFVLKIITREWRRLKEKWKSCTDVLSLLPRLSTASLSLSSLFCQPFGFERLTHPCRIVKEGGMFISSAISSSIFSASNSTTLNQTSKGLVKTVILFILMSFHSENVYNELLREGFQ